MSAAPRFEFIIWAPDFDPDSGGVIALHALCQRLNQMGVRAAMWPASQPGPTAFFGLPRVKSMIGTLLGRRKAFFQGPFANPVAKRHDLRGAVIVYPEIVSGNPLRASHVVRWLLHQPGFHMGRFSYSKRDMFAVYHEHFADPSLEVDQSLRLTVTWVNDAYRELAGTRRSGTCYLLRKGQGRPLVHDLSCSTLLDGMDHEQMAATFNRTERLYSYDLYTLYHVYAAICGCIPIVVPQPGLTREQWLPKLEDRYGLAYGEEDVPWAIATRGKMMGRIMRAREEEQGMLTAFVNRCRARFRARDDLFAAPARA